jgi:hypothetical protein
VGKIILALIFVLNLSTAAVGQTLWSASVEGGNLNEWSQNDCGGEFNSGNADTVASMEQARGTWAAKMTYFGGASGTRMFRWCEPQRNPELYYSAWFYFPQTYTPSLFWNIFQWKSKTSSVNDPFYVLNVGNRTDGSMNLYLYDWQRRISHATSAVIPVGRWIRIEAFYKCAADNTGRVAFWLDGQLLLDITGRSTRYSDGDCQWSIDNYSDGINPTPATFYVDDLSIALTRELDAPSGALDLTVERGR